MESEKCKNISRHCPTSMVIQNHDTFNTQTNTKSDIEHESDNDSVIFIMEVANRAPTQINPPSSSPQSPSIQHQSPVVNPPTTTTNDTQHIVIDDTDADMNDEPEQYIEDESPEEFENNYYDGFFDGYHDGYNDGYYACKAEYDSHPLN